MAMPSNHHARKVAVVTVAVVVVILAVIASYTYLEAMGRVTPQWALWVLPLATTLLTYLKAQAVEAKQDVQGELVQAVADRVVTQLAQSQSVAAQALAALPPREAQRILRDTPVDPPIPPDPDLRSPA